MKKWILPIILCIFLYPVSLYAFDDVQVQTHLSNTVVALQAREVISSNQSFHPYRGISRAELSKITLKAAGYPIASSDETVFSDLVDVVDEATWVRDVAEVAKKEGVVNGYDDGTFRPWKKVVWIEGLKIVLEALIDDIPDKNIELSSNAKANDWWTKYIVYAIEAGLLDVQVQHQFAFQGEMSRKDVVEMVYRVLEMRKTGATKYQFPSLTSEFVSAYRLEVPAIEVIAPVIYNQEIAKVAQSEDWNAYEQNMLKDLENGLVHYPFTSFPGHPGTTVITGHSSYYANNTGKYKDIFDSLEQLAIGDIASVYYQGQKFDYVMNEQFIVNPTDTWVLDQDFSQHRLILISCWPVGTNEKRYVTVFTLQ